MLVVDAANLFVMRILWQWLGIRAAGERLIAALGSKDENIRTLAGMFLVQTGRRSRPLIECALVKGQHPHMLIPILGDIGDIRSVAVLEKYIHDEDSATVRAALDAIAVLQSGTIKE